MIGAIQGAMGLGTALFGGLKAGRERRKQAELLKKQQADNNAYFNANYYADATQRSDAQHLMGNLQKQLKEQQKRRAGANAVMGGTNEALVAQKEQDSNTMSNTYSNIAQMGQQHKDKVQDTYMGRKAGLEEKENGMLEANARSGENLMATGLNAAASSLSQLPTPKFTNKKTASPNISSPQQQIKSPLVDAVTAKDTRPNLW